MYLNFFEGGSKILKERKLIPISKWKNRVRKGYYPSNTSTKV